MDRNEKQQIGVGKRFTSHKQKGEEQNKHERATEVKLKEHEVSDCLTKLKMNRKLPCLCSLMECLRKYCDIFPQTWKIGRRCWLNPSLAIVAK